MADAGIVEIGALALTAATTAYSVNAAAHVDKPKQPVMPDAPKAADTTSVASVQQQAQRQAETAGGTISSDPNENRRAGNDPNAPRKTLLGS